MLQKLIGVLTTEAITYGETLETDLSAAEKEIVQLETNIIEKDDKIAHFQTDMQRNTIELSRCKERMKHLEDENKKMRNVYGVFRDVFEKK